MIESLLPLLSGWSFNQIVKTNISIAAGSSKVIIEERRAGYIVELSIVVDNPDAKVILEESTVNIQFRYTSTLRELYDMGSVRWGPMGFYIDRYDDTNKVYIMSLKPSPWMPFNNLKITVEAPSSTPCNIARVSTTLAVIHDPTSFIESLRAILTGALPVPSPAASPFYPPVTVKREEECRGC